MNRLVWPLSALIGILFVILFYNIFWAWFVVIGVIGSIYEHFQKGNSRAVIWIAAIWSIYAISLINWRFTFLGEAFELFSYSPVLLGIGILGTVVLFIFTFKNTN